MLSPFYDRKTFEIRTFIALWLYILRNNFVALSYENFVSEISLVTKL